ncbi:MAG: nucleoside triphosphate pyrophosphohydrolase [Bacteroidota bacterium]
MTEAQIAFHRLVEIVEQLRVECPWDRKQTKESLRHLTIEETYELADAILKDDNEELKVELGDLLLHILFYSSLASQNGHFTLSEMIEAQIEKLIRRHPHVYGDLRGATEEEINANWEKIKAQEKALLGHKEASVLDGVPESLPSLIKAQRMQEKAANIGFDWTNKEDVWAKILEEMEEFRTADNPKHRAEEMGDLLFSLVNYCRFEGINAEDALARTNAKFFRRFQSVEEQARSAKQELSELSLETMETYWQNAKQLEKE